MFRPGAGPEFLDPPDMKGEGVIFGKRSPATASLVERTCKVAVATAARPTGNRIWKRKCVFCVGIAGRIPTDARIVCGLLNAHWGGSVDEGVSLRAQRYHQSCERQADRGK